MYNREESKKSFLRKTKLRDKSVNDKMTNLIKLEQRYGLSR